MSAARFSLPEFDALFDRLFSGTLSHDETAHLESLLLADEVLRDHYRDCVALHVMLGAYGAPVPVQHLAMLDEIDVTSLVANADVVTLDSHARHAGERSRFAFPMRFFSIAVSLVLVGYFIALGGLLAWDRLHRVAIHNQFASNRPDNSAVATISDAADVQWSKNTASKSTESSILLGEPLKIESGTIELELNTGTKLVVEGPADWSIDGRNSVSLRAGRLLARVPKQAIGFTVETPTARVVDLGTEFGVEVDASGTTETQVFRGAVEIESLRAVVQSRNPGKQKQRLVAGQAARVDATTETLRIETIVARPDQFVRHLSASEKAQESASNKKQDAPPSLYAKQVITKTRPVLYWNFDSPPHRITQDLVQKRAADNFSPVADGMKGPRPIDGFANLDVNNRALYVKGSHGMTCNEQVAKLGVSTDTYSVQMWFMSALPFDGQAVHTLFGRGNATPLDVELRDTVLVGGNYGGGCEPGRLYFLNGPRDFDGKFGKGISFPGATTLQPKTWYHLVLVRDGDAVRIYLNGKLEVSTQSPWLGGSGSCLTFANRVDRMVALGLNGYFDEVSIWNRALDDSEVLTTYRMAIDKESTAKE